MDWDMGRWALSFQGGSFYSVFDAPRVGEQRYTEHYRRPGWLLVDGNRRRPEPYGERTFPQLHDGGWVVQQSRGRRLPGSPRRHLGRNEPGIGWMASERFAPLSFAPGIFDPPFIYL